MPLPAALAPLRHPVFRTLWVANVVVSLGTWFQNTGAAWLMTSLAPNPMTVSLVQTATIVPIFLLAVPSGALADIVDRRLFLIAAQIWTAAAAAVLAAITISGGATPGSLLALTFAIGVGGAMTQPAWAAVIAEVVPRGDIVQAIALGGIGFNIARAFGPALAGFMVVLGGAGLAFALNAVSFFAVIAALVLWQRRSRASPLPREHFLSAIRAGMRFVRNTPAMRAAMVRSAVFFFTGAGPWALLPLVVRDQLGLGAGMFGLILGLMGVGGVVAGFVLPAARARTGRGTVVLLSSLLCSLGMMLLAIAHHALPAAFGMTIFGLGWVAGASTMQASAQLVAPAWVRARALGIYQLAFNGGLALGTFGWGWLASMIGLSNTLVAASIVSAVSAVAVRGFRLDAPSDSTPVATEAATPTPEEPAPELADLLPHTRSRVLESLHYQVAPRDRIAFLDAMGEVRRIRGRTGAVVWRLYEDVAHPDGWLEIWAVESWTDHLREQYRLSDEDRRALAWAASFHRGATPPAAARYIAVEPPNR